MLEQLLNALVLAGLLFLVSAGLSLVFGILRVVNFAHGVFYMIGAYLGFTTVALTGWFWPALVVVPPVVGALGAILESLRVNQEGVKYALVVHAGFKLRDAEVRGYLVIVLSVASLDRLLRAVEDWEQQNH